MCLDDFKKYPNSRNLRKRIGYKVFKQTDDGELLSEFGRGYDGIYDVNRWYKAYNRLILANNGIYYKSGFHIFLLKKDAEKRANDKNIIYRLILKKVKFKKPIWTGYERLYGREMPIVVANEMLIPED